MIDGEAIAGRWMKLRGIEMYRSADGYLELPWSLLDCYVLIAVSGGEGRVAVDTRLHLLRPESAVLCLPGQGVRVESEIFAGGRMYVVRFDMEERPGEPCPFHGERQAMLADADLAWCASMHDNWQTGNGALRLRSQAALCELLCSVAIHANAEAAGGMLGDLARVKAYMDRHYNEDITIGQLAAEMKVSARHFRRLFKDTYHISATDYLTQLRMNRAKQLMSTTDERFGDIGVKVGYQNENHFRRMFKQQVGMPPALYARNRKVKIGAYSWPNIGQLLPLQLVPHAAPVDQYWTDHYKRKLNGDLVAELVHDYALNRRILSALRPDYIIGIDSYITADEELLLKQVADTYLVPWEKEDWKTHLRLVGQFLDRPEEAERWLSRYEHRAQTVGALLDRVRSRTRLAVVMVHGKQLYLWDGESSDPCCGYPFPFAPRRLTAAMDAAFRPASVDELAWMNPDRLLVLLSEDSYSTRTWRHVQTLAAWNGMGAVRRRRAHTIPIGPCFDYTAYNHGLILEQALWWFGQIR